MIKKYTLRPHIYEVIQYTVENGFVIEKWSNKTIIEKYLQMRNSIKRRRVIPGDYLVKYPDNSCCAYDEESFNTIFAEIK